jgi:imidazolonepropionase-like amidohydrolase
MSESWKPEVIVVVRSLLCVLLVMCTYAQAGIAIHNVTVLDVTDGSLHSDQTVLVEGNRITAIGPADGIPIPEEVEVVDASGSYLIPGLWDMHVHSIWSVPKITHVVLSASADWHFPLFLAHGVTGIRNMNDGTSDVSLELVHSVKRRLAEGELIGPARVIANGPSVDGFPPLADNPVVVRTAEEARSVVDELADSGADFIKVYENLSREAYFAILDQARLRGLPVDGHLPFRVMPDEAAAAGQRTIEHPDGLAAGCAANAASERQRFEDVLSGYDALSDSEQFLAVFRHSQALYDGRNPGACGVAIEAYVSHGVAATVDVVAYHHVVQADKLLPATNRMQLVPQSVLREWQEMFDTAIIQQLQSTVRPLIPLELELVRLHYEAGVTLLAGTDVGVPLVAPGFSLHEELMRLVDAGLTPLGALQTATLNPAQVLGLSDSLGTVNTGKLADLVLLDANPLEDIRNTQKIRAVVANGRLFRRADLDRLLAEVVAMDMPEESPQE